MHLKDRLLGRPSVEVGGIRDLQALPRFYFESSSHSVLSTERLFRQWDRYNEETQYDAGDLNMEEADIKGKEIIVGSASFYRYIDTYNPHRSPGKDQTIQATL